MFDRNPDGTGFALSGGARRRRRISLRSGGLTSLAAGWDLGLLTRQAALAPAISSVEGLMASAEFQEHVRSRRRSPVLEREQVQAKTMLYKDLRRMDPDAFKRLLSRTDVQSYEAGPPSRALVAFDYLVGSVAIPLALAALVTSGLTSGAPMLRYGPVVAWLLAKLWLAGSGHASLLGRMLGVYLVYDAPEGQQYGNGWESMAGVGLHILLGLAEVALSFGSLGVLVLGSLASVIAGQRRQTLAMRLLGLRLEQETAR
ncbi:hypothetical protein GPECTOR_97g759 [Gonium pectorale]|uniref:RDD domain-containing protein n=1 Tax=Gonium pectorale TaxID=33097 RepID=A0A150G073_GONPE|nr:hypothetical protein GPECTOR_97g759 [Gonium pectorale]|eukprot:KXZ43221.1 hypothetical protein GPECTOR_97g759 [Gonium pectorale]